MSNKICRMRVLHIGSVNMFTTSFLETSKKHLVEIDHYFLTNQDLDCGEKANNVFCFSKAGLSWLFYFLKLASASNKIVLHSLFDPVVIILLLLQPWLIRKTIWVLWGGDLYYHIHRPKTLKSNLLEFFRATLIKRIPCITTTVDEDFLLAKKWYKTRASFFSNLMYKSHTFRIFSDDEEKISDEPLRIQVGNSADPGNFHLEIFEKLRKIDKQNFLVFCPLSYGYNSCASEIINAGEMAFGSRFFALTDLMSFEDYNKHLKSIDIAIFNHRRQQSMGNMIALLSLGKKVFLRNDVTPYRFFRKLGIEVFDSCGKLSLNRLDYDVKKRNVDIMRKRFNEEKLIQDWKRVLEIS